MVNLLHDLFLEQDYKKNNQELAIYNSFIKKEMEKSRLKLDDLNLQFYLDFCPILFKYFLF